MTEKTTDFAIQVPFTMSMKEKTENQMIPKIRVNDSPQGRVFFFGKKYALGKRVYQTN